MSDLRGLRELGNRYKCARLAIDEIERLREKVAELENWHREASETTANVALDYARMKIERNTIKQCLRDVVRLFLAEIDEFGGYYETNEQVNTQVNELMAAARYVPCERCTDGVLKGNAKQIWDDPEIHESCDCTNGWRPKDE
jgi:hypothetical protein